MGVLPRQTCIREALNMRIVMLVLIAGSLGAGTSSRPLTRSEQATIDWSVPHSSGINIR
jgi:hypothetical protein